MTEATEGPAKVSCKLEPMTGLTYDGAVNLAETHNANNHGKDADNV